MKIESYNRKQLAAFIESDLFKNLDKIPITRHRALSHINNPDCSEEDILLWAAYEEGSLKGFAGVLPGECRVDGTTRKIYWLSCFWVDQQYRRGTLASSLFYPLVQLYRDDLLISNFVPKLEKTYQLLSIFHPTIFRTGYRFYLDFCLAGIIPGRIPKAGFLKPFLQVTDAVLNMALSVRILAFKKQERECTVVENAYFDEQFQSFLSTFSEDGNFMKRGADHFGWIMAFPWIIQGKPDKESRRYFFSSRSRQFEYRSVKIYREKNLAGFMLLKIRDKRISLPYIYAHDDAVNDMATYLMDSAHREKFISVTTSDARLADAIARNRVRFIFLKRVNQPYILSKKITNSLWTFQEGDGDAVFT
jgi:hypothetical protein